MEPLIAVIVPVYKVEKFLNRCVESIVEQTYKNLEIILVDDGSPDNCAAICDEWAKKDLRIKAYHKENGGLSDARNFGVSKSTAEYITFIDSDDYVLPEYVEHLYRNLADNNADISCCMFKEVYGENKNISTEDKKEGDVTIMTGREACMELHTGNYGILTVAPCKLYPKYLVQKHPFPKNKLHEDEFTTYKYFYESDKVVISQCELYAYYQNPNSIMHSLSEKNKDDATQAFVQRIEYFEQLGDEDLRIISCESLAKYFLYAALIECVNLTKEQIKFVKLHFSEFFDKKLKLKLTAYIIFPHIYRMIIKIIGKVLTCK